MKLYDYRNSHLHAAAQREARAHLEACACCARVDAVEQALTSALEHRLPQYPASLGLKRRIAAQWKLSTPSPSRWGGQEGAMTQRRIRMSERVSLDEPSGANPTWFAVPLVVFALIALVVGLVARQTIREPYSTPFFHPFFTDTLQMKAWLVTAAMVLACAQLLTAARIYDLLRFPPKGRFYQRVHRWSGRAAILLTLPVAYHCVFLLGFATHSPRVWIHSLLGSALYGAIVAKVLIVRSTRFAPWVLPLAGGFLLSILLGLWLTSALWFFAAASSAG
jgi:uncharacterized protein DUF6529